MGSLRRVTTRSDRGRVFLSGRVSSVSRSSSQRPLGVGAPVVSRQCPGRTLGVSRGGV